MPKYLKYLNAFVVIILITINCNVIGAQCTVSGQTTPGFYATGNDQLKSATTSQTSYADTITWVSVASKSISVRGVIDQSPILSYRVDSIIGLPEGFSYTCDNGNCSWTYASTTAGCFNISGNPDTVAAGVYKLKIYHTFVASVLTRPPVRFPVDIHKVDSSFFICISGVVEAAGPDQFLCTETSTTLSAVTLPYSNGGWWSRVSGTGQILWPENATTVVVGLSEGENVFRWTSGSNLCGDGIVDDVVITKYPRVQTLTGNIAAGSYCAVDSIIVKGTIVAPDSVHLKAGEGFTFMPPYNIEVGAQLTTEMETCVSIK